MDAGSTGRARRCFRLIVAVIIVMNDPALALDVVKRPDQGISHDTFIDPSPPSVRNRFFAVIFRMAIDARSRTTSLHSSQPNTESGRRDGTDFCFARRQEPGPSKRPTPGGDATNVDNTKHRTRPRETQHIMPPANARSSETRRRTRNERRHRRT